MYFKLKYLQNLESFEHFLALRANSSVDIRSQQCVVKHLKSLKVFFFFFFSCYDITLFIR